MKKAVIIIAAIFLIACSSQPEQTLQPTPTTPLPEPEISCDKFFIEVDACRDDHTVEYTITGNAPFSYQVVGLGAAPFQGEYKEVKEVQSGTIQTAQRLSAIIINPYLDGIMCKAASVQLKLDDC